GVLAVAEADAAEPMEEVERLLTERAAAREARDWQRADAIREQLGRMDILVEDTADGQRWRRPAEVSRV
ncbi:MAG: hypothetical protein H0V36_00560, partial [Chloroflexi bacterium]|nr:hypothetical protein [Chloroflexota bacterium]